MPYRSVETKRCSAEGGGMSVSGPAELRRQALTGSEPSLHFLALQPHHGKPNEQLPPFIPGREFAVIQLHVLLSVTLLFIFLA